MNQSFVRALFGFTLLLIGTNHAVECQSTVDMESDDSNFKEIHQISLLLVDLKKTMERFEMHMLQTSSNTRTNNELRLENIDNGVNQLLQQKPQSSNNNTSPTDVEMRLEKIENGMIHLLQQMPLISKNDTSPSNMEMRLEKIENGLDGITQLLQQRSQTSINYTSLSDVEKHMEKIESGVTQTLQKMIQISINNTSPSEVERCLEKMENGVAQLLQQTPKNSVNNTSPSDVEMRLEKIMNEMNHLLQQMPHISTNDTSPSKMEMRLEKIENRLDGVAQLLQQRSQTSIDNTSLSDVERHLEKIENGVTETLQKMVQISINNTSPSEVEMRLEKMENGVAQLLQQTLKNSANNTSPSDVEMRLEKIMNGTSQLLQETQKCSTYHTNTEVKMLKPTLTYSLSGSSGVLATALLNDQLFVSRYNARHVSVYSTTTFQLQRQLTIPGLGSHVNGLATCASNKVLYVSDWFNDCVHKVDLSITNTNDVIKWNLASQPAGLSVNRARNVLVAHHSAKKVQEYTPSGSLVREISDSNYLYHAVELNSGMLAVSRYGPIHGVAMVTMDGHVIHSYENESRGSRVGRMTGPSSIAVDNDGYILVADIYNNRILIVNPLMTDSRQLPLPVNISSQNPRALSLDQSRGRLYVGELSGHNSRVLVFDNVFNVGALFNSR